jgi:hypothetical protein
MSYRFGICTPRCGTTGNKDDAGDCQGHGFKVPGQVHRVKSPLGPVFHKSLVMKTQEKTACLNPAKTLGTTSHSAKALQIT